ncbi:MAG: PEP-CTERM sorting domain-containing protein [Bryobacteraceae bacterium]
MLVLGITATNSARSSAPEPSTIVLFSSALVGLSIFARHRS